MPFEKNNLTWKKAVRVRKWHPSGIYYMNELPVEQIELEMKRFWIKGEEFQSKV